jgi:sugar lactone lactonase YvrE
VLAFESQFSAIVSTKLTATQLSAFYVSFTLVRISIVLSMQGMNMKTLKDETLMQPRLGSSIGLFAAAFFAVIGLSGCGGGGGGDSAVSTPTVPPAAASGISLFAGALGGEGNADGTPGRLATPTSIAIDSKGNVFVLDTNNCNIRKIVGSVVSRFYGPKSCDDPPSTNASPVQPSRTLDKVITDSADNVYITTKEGLFKLLPDGTSLPDPLIPLSFIGDDFRLFSPLGFDSDGAIIAMRNNAIYQLKFGGAQTLIAGNSDTFLGNDDRYADGAGAAAKFNSPQGFAIASDGVIYVADTGNHVIRKVTRAGVVSTIAGSPRISGSADGIGSAAQFNNPSSIAVDGAGNLFVADQGSYTVRKITPAGVVTTLAGTPGAKGALDGAGAVARFNYLTGSSMGVDKSGVVFVADYQNHAVRRISPDGNVTTIAGLLRSPGALDGAGGSARFNDPREIAIDATGDILVVDSDRSTIRKISPTGAVSTLAGNPNSNLFSSVDGIGANASFSRLSGIAVDKVGNGYATERTTFKVRKITAAGEVTTTKTYALSGGLISPGFPPGSLGPSVYSIAADNDSNLYVILFANYGGSTSRYLSKIIPSGADAVFLCGTDCYPEGVATDNAGNVYVAAKNAIRRISPTGVVTYLAGDPSARRFGSADGVGTAASFGLVEALATDSKGNVFVADTDNHTVRKITAAGVVTTIAGKAGVSGVMTGSLPGLLNGPRGIVVDSAGAIFVTTEDAVVKIIP